VSGLNRAIPTENIVNAINVSAINVNAIKQFCATEWVEQAFMPALIAQK
jgi:hypothetical protein